MSHISSPKKKNLNLRHGLILCSRTPDISAAEKSQGRNPTACPSKAPWSPTAAGAPDLISPLTLLLTTSVPKGLPEPQPPELRWSKWKCSPGITLSAPYLFPGHPLLGSPPAAAPCSRWERWKWGISALRRRTTRFGTWTSLPPAEAQLSA